jgi:YD repeat-containing protein
MSLGASIRPLLIGAVLAVLASALSGEAQAQPSASPFTSAARYDALGRLTGTISPDPDGTGPRLHLAVRNTYDAAGRLIRVETGALAAWQSEAVAPAGWAGFTVAQTVDTTYDAMGRKTSDTLSAGGAVQSPTQYSYDAFGRLDCSAVRMNPAALASPPPPACEQGTVGSQGPDRITHNVYDAAGQLLGVQRAYATPLQQSTVSYTYSPNGNRTSVTDANGNRAELRYDGHDRQVRWVFPSPTTAGAVNEADYEAYGYDADGNRTALRKRDGVTLTYQYDALDRLTVKTVPQSASGAAGYSVFYGYDLRSLQTYARFGSASGPGVTNADDALGRLASSTTTLDGISRTLNSAYDAAGNRTAYLRGRVGEEVLRRYLTQHGYTIVGDQTHVVDDHGNLRIVDFIVRGGGNGLLGIEAKYDTSTRNARQRMIDANLRDEGGRVTSLIQPGLRYGERVQFNTIEIRVRPAGTPVAVP